MAIGRYDLARIEIVRRKRGTEKDETEDIPKLGSRMVVLSSDGHDHARS